MREFAIFNISYEDALTFVNEMKHEDINTLKLNVADYDSIVKLYANLLSRTRAFEYDLWLDNSDLTFALTVKDAMATQNALYNTLRNGNLHIKVFRAIERVARAMSNPTIEFHR